MCAYGWGSSRWSQSSGDCQPHMAHKLSTVCCMFPSSLACADAARGFVQPKSLTFTSANWGKPQKATLTGGTRGEGAAVAGARRHVCPGPLPSVPVPPTTAKQSRAAAWVHWRTPACWLLDCIATATASPPHAPEPPTLLLTLPGTQLLAVNPFGSTASTPLSVRVDTDSKDSLFHTTQVPGAA